MLLVVTYFHALLNVAFTQLRSACQDLYMYMTSRLHLVALRVPNLPFLLTFYLVSL